ncbi:aldo/keto reductase [Mucisphaera sp.]|uniref:aldo/keto reductase n=1 Tax=Mucisphaera sp. TaxID=2913024 RepID=UPI003D14EEE1
MEYRRLGKSGLQVSALSFGSWVTFGKQVESDAADRLMGMAYDAGVNFFDNAEGYERGRSEELMGEALGRLGWRRDSYCVSSKVWWGTVRDGEPRPCQRGLSRKHVVECCDGAIRRMGCEYLDLYFCHRYDPETPVGETVLAMDNLIRQGKVLYWGTSNWSAAQIFEAYDVAVRNGLIPPTMEQAQYNLLNREPVERSFSGLYDPGHVGLGTTIYSPLASGLLTGKYNDGIPDGSRLDLPGYEWLKEMLLSDDGRRLKQVKALGRVADEVGLSMTRFAVAWVLSNRNVSTAILGASRPEQLEETLKAVGDVEKITEEVKQRVDEVLGG